MRDARRMRKEDDACRNAFGAVASAGAADFVGTTTKVSGLGRFSPSLRTSAGASWRGGLRTADLRTTVWPVTADVPRKVAGFPLSNELFLGDESGTKKFPRCDENFIFSNTHLAREKIYGMYPDARSPMPREYSINRGMCYNSSRCVKEEPHARAH
jgi:hypothetical protein